MLVLSCTGCATQWCHLPDDCAHAFNQTQLGWELQDICKNGLQGGSGRGEGGCGEGVDCGDDCGCGIQVFEDAVWLDDGPELAPRPRIVVGPPPEPYVPPMPPKFLPVPARPVF